MEIDVEQYLDDEISFYENMADDLKTIKNNHNFCRITSSEAYEKARQLIHGGK
jgi:hypothetical protein